MKAGAGKSRNCFKCGKPISLYTKTGKCKSCVDIAKIGVKLSPCSEERKKKIGDAHRGKKLSEETRKRIGDVQRGKKKSPRSVEHRQKISEYMKRLWREEWFRTKALNNMRKTCATEEHRQKMSKRQIGRIQSKETRDKIRLAVKKIWNTEEFQNKMWAAFKLKPTEPEKRLNDILCDLFPNEYKYVGDFTFWLGGKNPDFVNINSKKKIIELYGEYWHRGQNPQDRIDHFKQYGFDTLVIWEKELDCKKILESKLMEFHGE